MNEHRIDPALTVNQILLDYPAAVSVFNAFGVDTCCGGGVPLTEAAHRDGLDLGQLLAALESAISRAERATR